MNKSLKKLNLMALDMFLDAEKRAVTGIDVEKSFFDLIKICSLD